MNLKSLKAYWVFVFILLFFTCKKKYDETKVEFSSEENFELGKPKIFHDRLSKVLKIDSFISFKALTHKIQELNCQSITPIIKISTKENTTDIYLKDACLKNYGCILIKERNKIEVFKEGVLKSGKLNPANEFYNILKQDLNNFGKNPSWSDNPSKVIVYLSLWDNEIDVLEQKLIEISNAYQKLDSSYNLNIYLRLRMKTPPPPPPPKELVN